MPLALDVTTMDLNRLYKLATTTSEDTLTLTGATPGAPVAIQITSNVAWAFSDATGNLASKIPMTAGGTNTPRLTGPITYYIMNQASSGTLYVFRPV